jgi:hypothetical protein
MSTPPSTSTPVVCDSSSVIPGGGGNKVFNVVRVYAGILVNFQNWSSALNGIADQLEIQNGHLDRSLCSYSNRRRACNQKSQRNKQTFASQSGHRTPSTLEGTESPSMNIPQGPYRSKVCFESRLSGSAEAHSATKFRKRRIRRVLPHSKAICCKCSSAAPVRDSPLPRMQQPLQKHLPRRLVLILACSPLPVQSFVRWRCECQRA